MLVFHMPFCHFHFVHIAKSLWFTRCFLTCIFLQFSALFLTVKSVHERDKCVYMSSCLKTFSSFLSHLHSMWLIKKTFVSKRKREIFRQQNLQLWMLLFAHKIIALTSIFHLFLVFALALSLPLSRNASRRRRYEAHVHERERYEHERRKKN